MRSITTAAALLIASASVALAEPRFGSTAEMLDAVRSGRVREGTYVTLTRATITTRPVENGHDGPNAYMTWFYVNDAGRDGDGVVVSLPSYYSGTNPFDEDDDNPYENDIELPTLRRGYEISVSGVLSSRLDGQGYVLDRPLDRYESYFLDYVTTGSGDEAVERIVTSGLTVLSTTEAPPPRRPSGLRVTPAAGVQPRDIVVITGRDLGDRAKLTFDGRALEVLSRRPGALVAVVPATAQPGDHVIRVRNPEVTAPSGTVRLRVVAAVAPDAPQLTSAERTAGLLLLRGKNLTGAGAFEVRAGTRRLDVLHRDARSVLVELPAGVTGSVTVRLGGRESNAVAIPAATTGLTGSIPGQ